MFEWAWPWLFLLLPLPWLALRWRRPRTQVSAALRLPYAGVLDLGAEESGKTPNTLGAWWTWLVWAALVVAVARPQWIGEALDVPRSGREMLLALDVSGSMNTPDMTLGNRQATRFSVMQAIVGDFIERRTGDRVGMVLFGSRAYLLTPLTFDLKTVRTQLEEATVGLAGRETAIGDALGLAVKRLHDRPEAQRVVVLLTDGVNTAGELDPRRAAELAKAEKVRVYTIALGAEQMRVDDFFGSRVVNPSADLDVALMTEIAEKTGGRFYRARDTKELAGIYREIDALEPAADQSEKFRPVDELFHLPLGIALLVALIGLAGLPWRWGVQREGAPG
ncbi:vWA domain-containing protein [Tahibacter amnicola]|uniref:VWA domain-containing protein n=1 Tax=Tahibacter amnicola TaxID=2976241 RepID=A0ABY6BGL2_9GAMM|nr:VWA domain-containing protein [Tahibacter amnicola]UXI68999.1 VWA domain-containing protein [Tahibacter amnicola]